MFYLSKTEFTSHPSLDIIYKIGKKIAFPQGAGIPALVVIAEGKTIGAARRIPCTAGKLDNVQCFCCSGVQLSETLHYQGESWMVTDNSYTRGNKDEGEYRFIMIPTRFIV